ncbi:MAG: asparagine synthase-related protein [Candidatus Kapaibacterium sp.]
MSWILGAHGLHSPDHASSLRKIASLPLFEYHDAGMSILAGGIPETCAFGKTDGGAWTVCGLGIERAPDGFRLLDTRDWHERLEQEGNLQKLEGQFAGIHYRNGELTLFTDRIGSRDLYFTSLPGVTLFSTRLDWLARLSRKDELDLHEFGGRWLFFYQLSTGSIIKNIIRLGPGAEIKISPKGTSISRVGWNPGPASLDFASTLEQITTFPFQSNHRVTLGLSGGLDSRLLFSLLLQANGAWDVHTFGPPEHPDAIIAKQIAKAFGIPHRHLYIEPLDDPDLGTKVEDFCAQSLALRPASSILQLQHYPMLREDRTIVIDGSFGEVARRQMLNRIAIMGRRALLERDMEKIFSRLARFRADFFTEETNMKLRSGAMAQVEALWSEMPDPRSFGIGNWLDLLVVRAGLPNVNAAEQARIDHYVPGFTPFVQPSFLNAAFRLPIRDRRGGKAFRALIHRTNPRLESFPRVVIDCTVPYSFSTLFAFAWREMKLRLGKTYRDRTNERFLLQMRPMIEDLSHSESVRTYPLYDQRKVRAIVDGYFAGNLTLGPQLNWWLGFELWRSAL